MLPANDHMFWAIAPNSHFPGVVIITTAGPADHISVAKRSAVLVGTTSEPPRPQAISPELDGVIKPC